MANFFDGVIEETSVKPPIAVLKELGKDLEAITKGLLVGVVAQGTCDSQFSFSFYITAPSLNNYSYHVLKIKHDLSFYPLRIVPTDENIFNSDVKESSDLDEYFKEYRYIDVKNQEELEGILKKIISSSQVKKVINGLLAQIKST